MGINRVGIILKTSVIIVPLEFFRTAGIGE